MGSITIRFVGICTQIKLGRPGAFHRAVLVHAEDGRTVGTVVVPAHYGSLAVDSPPAIIDMPPHDSLHCLTPGKFGTWHLDGARLRVANAIDGGPTYDRTSYDVPSLTVLTPDFGQLSDTVVLGIDAACQFDITSGTFFGEKPPGGAWETVVEITTTDDTARIEIEDMAHPSTQTQTLTLKSGTSITVSNTGDPARTGDTSQDFLLHYLTAKKVPDDAKVPDEANDPQCGEGLGPGCSNSNFP